MKLVHGSQERPLSQPAVEVSIDRDVEAEDDQEDLLEDADQIE